MGKIENLAVHFVHRRMAIREPNAMKRADVLLVAITALAGLAIAAGTYGASEADTIARCTAAGWARAQCERALGQ